MGSCEFSIRSSQFRPVHIFAYICHASVPTVLLPVYNRIRYFLHPSPTLKLDFPNATTTVESFPKEPSMSANLLTVVKKDVKLTTSNPATIPFPSPFPPSSAASSHSSQSHVRVTSGPPSQNHLVITSQSLNLPLISEIEPAMRLPRPKSRLHLRARTIPSTPSSPVGSSPLLRAGKSRPGSGLNTVEDALPSPFALPQPRHPPAHNLH